MTARYTVKPKAGRDLDDYADYLAREVNLDMALSFLAAGEQTFALLAQNPHPRVAGAVKVPQIENASLISYHRIREDAHSLQTAR